MPNLVLGNIAKEVAKARFRGFNITLPAIKPYTGPSLRAPGLQMARQTHVQTATLAPVGGGASRLANFGVKSSGSSSISNSSSNPPATATPMQFPPALFRAASNSEDDVDNQRGMHDMFNQLFDGIIDAIEYGFNQYRQTAGLVDLMIMAATAGGGRLQGLPLDGLIKRAPSVAGWGGWEAMVRDAVAGGMEHQWSALARSVRVPNLNWYPAFIVWMGAVASPLPNIPSAFFLLDQDATATDPFKLKTAMRSALRGNMDYCMEFFESVAVAFQIPLQVWKFAQPVMQVMGTGPVPSYSPPLVHAGPVMGGTNLPGAHINT